MNYNFKDTTPHQNEPMADDNYYTDFTELDKSIEYSLTELSELIKTKGNGKAVRDIFSLAFKLIEQIDGIEDYHNEKYDEYYQKFSETLSEFNILKPEAKNAIQESKEALAKSQNALNVANGIDAKATNALSLSESAETLSKSVQEQFNQVIIDGDSSVEAAQARVDASGQTNATLKARLDKEHNEVTAQLAQTVKKNDILSMDNMGQDVKEAMSGGSVAVVGEGAVGVVNLNAELGMIVSNWKALMTNENESWVV